MIWILNGLNFIPATWPAGIDEPSCSPMPLHFFSQHSCILSRMQHYKCCTKAGWKCCLWLLNTILCPSHLFKNGAISKPKIHLNLLQIYFKVYWRNSRFNKYQSSITTDEMIHGLRQAQLAHGWENPKCITRQKDDILWMRTNTWHLSIRNKLYRICCPCVFCNSISKRIKRRAQVLDSHRKNPMLALFKRYPFHTCIRNNNYFSV